MFAIGADRTAAPADDPAIPAFTDDPDMLFIGLALCALNMADQRTDLLAWSNTAHTPLTDIPLRPREGSSRNRPLNVSKAKGQHVWAVNPADFTCRLRDRKPIFDRVNPDPVKSESRKFV
jgi:hypothetical protein